MSEKPEQRGLKNIGHVIRRDAKTAERMLKPGEPLSFLDKSRDRVGRVWVCATESLHGVREFLVAKVSSGRAVNGRASGEARREKAAANVSVSSGTSAQNVTEGIARD